jgi:hypothetical protein
MTSLLTLGGFARSKAAPTAGSANASLAPPLSMSVSGFHQLQQMPSDGTPAVIAVFTILQL